MAKKNKLKYYIGAGGLAALLLIYFLNGFAVAESVLTNSTDWIRSKLFQKSQSMTITADTTKSIVDYQLENKTLQVQLADLLYENASLQRLKRENEDLKAISGYTRDHVLPSVIAQVIGHDPILENTLVLDQGTDSGVKIGNAVVAGKGNIIGKIIDAGQSQSTVLLITDSQIRLSVTKADEIASIGIAQGDYGLSVVVDLIPQTVQLKQNDMIVTGNLDPAVPPGLILGKVNRTLSKENDLFKKVTLIPLLDYQNIAMVSVIITK